MWEYYSQMLPKGKEQLSFSDLSFQDESYGVGTVINKLGERKQCIMGAVLPENNKHFQWVPPDFLVKSNGLCLEVI